MEQVSGSGDEIIHLDVKFVVMRSFTKDDKTGTMVPLLLFKYRFEGGLLVRGPIILNPEVNKDLNYSVKDLEFWR